MLCFNALGYQQITEYQSDTSKGIRMGYFATQAMINSVLAATVSAFFVYIVLLAVRMQASLVRIICGGLTGMVCYYDFILCSTMLKALV